MEHTNQVIKMNWGHKLVFFMVLFMLFILGMVFYISGEKVELVSDNYYEQGINYQQVIDKFTVKEGTDFTFNYNAELKQVHVQLMTTDNREAVFSFYRPSDSKKDFTIKAKADEQGFVSVPVNKLSIGVWKVTCEWNVSGKTVAFTKELKLQE